MFYKAVLFVSYVHLSQDLKQKAEAPRALSAWQGYLYLQQQPQGSELLSFDGGMKNIYTFHLQRKLLGKNCNSIRYGTRYSCRIKIQRLYKGQNLHYKPEGLEQCHLTVFSPNPNKSEIEAVFTLSYQTFSFSHYYSGASPTLDSDDNPSNLVQNKILGMAPPAVHLP